MLQYAAGEAEQALGLPAHDKMTDADGRTITSRQYASRGSVNTLLANIYAWMGGLTQDAKYWEQAEHYASQVIDEFAGDYELENMTDLIGNVFGKNRHSKETIFSIDNDILDDAHIYDTRFAGELPGQELIDYPYTNVSPQSLSTDKNQEYNRISVKTVKEIYPEENDLRRKEFWYDLGHVSYTVEGEEVTSPYAFIHKWRDYHYQTNSEMLEGQESTCSHRLRLCFLAVGRRRVAACRMPRAAQRRRRKTTSTGFGRGPDWKHTPGVLNRKRCAEIFNERRRELFGEGQYYFDIVRNGYYREMLRGKFKTLTDEEVRNGALYTWLA